MRLEPIVRMPSLESAVWRRFAVHAFEGKVTVDDMDRMEESADRWLRRNPGKMVEMVIIFPSDAGMTGDERKRMAALIKRWEANRAASATVILATGIAGSMHRSVLTGLMMLAPPPHPAKVFGSVRDAAVWLAPHIQSVCADDTRADALTSAIDEMTSSFRARRRSAGLGAGTS